MSTAPDSRVRRPASKTSSRPRRRSAISTAIAACSRTADTTSTISPRTRPSKRCVICCGTAGCRRARSSANCSRSSPRHDRCPKVVRLMRIAAAGRRHGPAAHARVRAGALRSGRADNSRRRRNYRKAVRLTAQTGSIVATMGRLQAGGGPIAAGPGVGHAANFLYMLTGRASDALATRAFDVALVAARRSRAERVDVRGARRGGDAHRHAFGGRRGDRHAEGTAARRRERGSDEDAARDRRRTRAREDREVVRGKLARKEKIPGFGHRVYHTEDPRATHLRQMSRELGKRAGQPQWFEMSERIEAWSRPRRS